MNRSPPLLLGPQSNCAGGEGAGDVDEALVAAAAKAEADVALGLDKWSLDKDIKLTHNIKQGDIGNNFLPSVASVTPHIITKFLLDAVDERTRALGLLKRISSTQGNRCLIIGDDLHQLVKGAFFPTLEVPRLGVVATRAMMITARQID